MHSFFGSKVLDATYSSKTYAWKVLEVKLLSVFFVLLFTITLSSSFVIVAATMLQKILRCK